MNKLLIFSDWYLPGYKAGGPIASLKNLVYSIENELNIYIVTSDRDLNDLKPYNNIITNEWSRKSNHSVFYISNENVNVKSYLKIINEIKPNAIYVNGIYSLKFSIMPLLAIKIAGYKKKVIVAPRGMLSQGALEVKGTKKRMFLLVSKLIGLYKNIHWHHTSQQEILDTKKLISNDISYTLIKNLPKLSEKIEFNNSDLSVLKIITISRVSKIKNIDFIIDVLSNYKFKKAIELDIYGLIEDSDYLQFCKSIIDNKINDNLVINFKNELQPDLFSDIISNYHLAIFPTLNENYGHAIVECLSYGLPVIISNRTPWNNINKFNCGFEIDLNDKNKWIDAINYFSNIDKFKWNELSENARNYFLKHIYSQEDKNNYIAMFQN